MSLYTFESTSGATNEFTFTNCGNEGKMGPSLATCRSSYGGSLNDGKWWNSTIPIYFDCKNSGTFKGLQQWTVPKRLII